MELLSSALPAQLSSSSLAPHLCVFSQLQVSFTYQLPPSSSFRLLSSQPLPSSSYHRRSSTISPYPDASFLLFRPSRLQLLYPASISVLMLLIPCQLNHFVRVLVLQAHLFSDPHASSAFYSESLMGSRCFAGLVEEVFQASSCSLTSEQELLSFARDLQEASSLSCALARASWSRGQIPASRFGSSFSNFPYQYARVPASSQGSLAILGLLSCSWEGSFPWCLRNSISLY